MELLESNSNIRTTPRYIYFSRHISRYYAGQDAHVSPYFL